MEGYKREPVPKVLVARTRQQLELGSELTGLAALAVPFDAGDGDLDNKEWNAFLNQAEPGKAWDVLNLNDPDEIAEWVKAFINRSKGRN
ncbi:hypothetical protein N6H14_04180 [Paenibacillus sp. CC-CFT747]|nr:hypothetical protein N6H14_04180 [Paenibacillus sp. CC-CFT747]